MVQEFRLGGAAGRQPLLDGEAPLEVGLRSLQMAALVGDRPQVAENLRETVPFGRNPLFYRKGPLEMLLGGLELATSLEHASEGVQAQPDLPSTGGELFADGQRLPCEILRGSQIVALHANFLFVKGDLNLRHALPDWGMLLKTESIFILIGIYFLIQREEKKQKHLLLFFGFLIILSIFPGSLTRDGGGHATRSFLLLVPLTLLAALGAETVVKQARYLLILFLPLLIFESAFYFFDYSHRYVFLSQRQWHFGLKEIVLLTKNKTNPVVITNSYEPPVIFYLYYSGYPVKEMQSLIRDDKLLVTIPTGANLSGRKITDREVYFASIDNRNDKEPLKLKPATYYLMKSDLPNHEDYFKLDRVVVKLPSGEPLFYEIKNL